MIFKQTASLLLLSFFFSTSVICQKKIETKQFKSDYTKKENRISFKEDLLNRIHSTLSKNLNSVDEYSFRKVIEDAGMYLIKNTTVENAVSFALENFEKYSDKFNISLLETVYTLYPHKYGKVMKKILHKTHNDQIFIICSLYLLNNTLIDRQELVDLLGFHFRNKDFSPRLKYFNDVLRRNPELPSLADLLKHDFQTNKTIVYSFHRKDRTYPGVTIIKGPDGKFSREDDGSIFHIPHLSRSVSNLPGFLKNGNTPQGIFTIVGYYVTPTESIGPTPILLTRSPFEKPTRIFYHGKQKSNKWNIKEYKSLLPESWQHYYPITEAYYAGAAGRRLIIAHGTADDISFYEKESYYPFTPTKGCLSTKEIWDDNGRLIESDQVKLMNAFFSTNQLKGFLVVVEIDSQKKPVTIDELLPAIFEAEK